MRIIFYILIISLLFSCSKKKENKLTPQSNNSELNGVWGLDNYFNGILTDKEIAKHRLQAPSWFAILLKIKNDSIKTYGSIFELNSTLNHSSDTLVLFNSISKYVLCKRNNNLILTELESPNKTKTDTTKYVFSKRNDLETLLENQNKIHKISSSIIQYFNKNLIAGTYENIKNKKNIIFEKQGTLKNFKGFDKYEVRNYFGTYHPHKNKDVITFINSISNKRKQFNWKFKGDTLVLTEFTQERNTDFFILGNHKIILKLKK